MLLWCLIFMIRNCLMNYQGKGSIPTTTCKCWFILKLHHPLCCVLFTEFISLTVMKNFPKFIDNIMPHIISCWFWLSSWLLAHGLHVTGNIMQTLWNLLKKNLHLQLFDSHGYWWNPIIDTNSTPLEEAGYKNINQGINMSQRYIL